MKPGAIEQGWERRKLYPIVGALLAQGAALGLLAIKALHFGGWPTATWLVAELASQYVTYVYLALSTTVVFVLLGRALGQREDQLRASSLTDPLTGLANRRHFEAVLRERLALSARTLSPLSLLIVDLDCFKKVNDSRGHAVGDAALRHVAECLLGTCRVTDLAARIGGDEFAVVVTGTRADSALELAERVRSSLAMLPRSAALQGLPLSVSIGVADLDIAGSGRPEALVAAADRALFRAKAGGRDRVVVGLPEETSPGGSYGEATDGGRG